MLKSLNRRNTRLFQERPIKVLQFGEGNFLRAFADWVIDILNEKTDFNGNVQIIQPIAHGLGTQVNKQEGLYHVTLNGIKKGKLIQDVRLINSVAGAINPYEDYEAFLKTAENPDIKFIISNTTEAGIEFIKGDISLDTVPATFPGKLTALLYHRFTFFDDAVNKAVTILPCELIDKNGSKLKATVLKYCELWQLNSEFQKWVQDDLIFCNTLVDRIVPGFPKGNINEIQNQIGFSDNLVVTAEPFHLWVIETEAKHFESLKENFPTAKAGLDVKLVTDLSPYRTRKVRILNGAHTALVPVAYLRGLRTVMESVDDEYMGKFIRKIIFDEIIPTLDMPIDELKMYANDVIERFQNPYIHHELKSIALNSISKFKVRVLPTILEYFDHKGTLPANLIHSLAALILFYKGEHRGISTPVDDTEEVKTFMEQVWKVNDQTHVVAQVLSNTAFWDQDLNLIAGLHEAVLNEMNSIISLKP